MFASRLPWLLRGAANPVRRTVAMAAVIVLASTLVMTPASRARDGGIAPMQSAIEPIVSASSWLAISGLDPRYPGPTTTQFWGTAGREQASAEAASAPAPAVGPSRIITKQLGLAPFSSEPSLAIDPNDPSHLILGVSALDLPSAATYVSRDGGASWIGPNQAPHFPLDAGSVGGPTVAFDRAGTAYLLSRSIDLEELQVGNDRVPNIRTRIVVSKSTDGGVAWSDPVSALLATTDVFTATDELGQSMSDFTLQFFDHPSIAIGPDSQRPERDIVVIAYTEFQTRFNTVTRSGGTVVSPMTVETTIRLIRSTDGGLSWSEPVAVSPTATLATAPAGSASNGDAPPDVSQVAGPTASSRRENQAVQGPRVAFLANGSLVVAYVDTTQDGPRRGLARVMVTTSEDGGRTFSDPATAGIFQEIGLRPRTAFFHWWSGAFPRIAAGPDGQLYIAVTVKPGDRPSDDADVLVLGSLDAGSTWDAPVRLGDDDSNASQFFPEIAVAPDGTVHAIWADLRDDPHRVAFTLYYAQSTDDGRTWTTGADAGAVAAPVSDVMTNTLLGFPGGLFLGDRLALAASEADVLAAWPDTRMADGHAPAQQIAFSRLPSAN